MLDIHTHVLPGIDDGARTPDEALALLRALADDGVTHVVATPHIYPGVYDNTADGIATVFARLNAQAQAAALPLTLSWAAEVRICAEMLDWLAAGRLPLLNGGRGSQRFVLLELPDNAVPVGADTLVARLVDAGVTPVIAHPERNRAIADRPQRIDALVRAGARLQLTAASVLGEFGERAATTAQLLLRQGLVEVVASDSHNLRSRRPRMGAARAWLAEHFGAEVAEQLTETNPARLAGMGEVAVVAEGGWPVRDLPDAGSAAPAQAAGRISAADLADWTAGTSTPANAGLTALNLQDDGTLLAAAPSGATNIDSPFDLSDFFQASAPAAPQRAEPTELDFTLPDIASSASLSASLDAVPEPEPSASALPDVSPTSVQVPEPVPEPEPAPAAVALVPAVVPSKPAVPTPAPVAAAPARTPAPSPAPTPAPAAAPADPASAGFSLADFTLLHPASGPSPRAVAGLGGTAPPYRLPADAFGRNRKPARGGPAIARATSGLSPLAAPIAEGEAGPAKPPKGRGLKGA